MQTITIIDTFGFLFRNFYALPPLRNQDGFPTGLLTGFCNFIYNLGKDYDTSYILFALDSKGAGFRHDIYPEYKANRQEAPEDLKMQLPIAIEWIEKMGFSTLSQSRYEADDIIASIATLAVKQGLEVKVISHDKDLNQLITDKIQLFDPAKKVIFSPQDCFEKFGVYPENFVDYQAILGDSSDNIPGVKGIGIKGASKLIGEYKTLENIYQNIDLFPNNRTKQLLIESQEKAFISRELATLKTDLFEDFSFRECVFPEANPILKIEDELSKYEITNILNKVRSQGMYVKTNLPSEEIKEKDFESILLDNDQALFDTIAQIQEHDLVAFDTETDSLDVKVAKIVGFSFCFEKTKAYYVPIAHLTLGDTKQISKTSAKKALEILLQKKIIGHNLKFDKHIVYNNCTVEVNLYADTILMAWVLNPSSEKSLDFLSNKHLNHRSIKFKDIVPRGKTFADIDVEQASGYASEDAWMTFRLYHILIQNLEPKMQEELESVEYPFLQTLFLMEQEGIRIDLDFFAKFQKSASETIKNLTTQIQALASESFNINSTKQLGAVLFDKMGLTAVKKTKTGYSTDESSLKQIEEEHEIIGCILEYREIFKLQSTYIEPLIEYGNKDERHRICTTFSQTGTSTGRLSSNSPNLQNIPVRNELGKKIREGFVADEGHSLIGIDYSQIELLLLAHFSEDAYLLEAFHNDQDIHYQTALKLFGEEKAKDKRDVAKSINFGILYGMGSRKLSQILKIPAKEAKEYIESYFNTFASVKQTLDTLRDSIATKEYVETLLGRKRLFNYSQATDFEKSNYLREGVNAVFQGSAADLIKMSMNQITEKYANTDTKILLQIHDEVILETPSAIAPQIAQECQEIMENITTLKVPLKTSVHIGQNWGELK